MDGVRRDATRANHSATHLLHAALRKVLGTHVTQKGSLVAPDRLRFDFSHYSAVTPEELAEIERLVNAEIRANAAAETRLMKFDEAVAAGAMALFGEKYDDEVRVLRIGEFSTELCGGTHVGRAGDIGLFKIVSEGGVAAGVRRIEAVTGEGAFDHVADTEHRLRDVAGLVRGSREDVEEKVRQLIERSRRLEKEVAQLKDRLASGRGKDLADEAQTIGSLRVVATSLEGADAAALRNAVDQLKGKLGSAVIVLGASGPDGKVTLIAGVTADPTAKVKAGELVNFVAQQVGGRGGGRPDLAQAGGTDASQLPAALASVADSGCGNEPAVEPWSDWTTAAASSAKIPSEIIGCADIPCGTAYRCATQQSGDSLDSLRGRKRSAGRGITSATGLPQSRRPHGAGGGLGSDESKAAQARSSRMLILTRRVGETVMIGNDVTVTVLGVKGNQVRVGVNAPRDVAVHREEIYERIKREEQDGGPPSGQARRRRRFVP